LKIGVLLLSPTPEISSRVKATLAVSKVLPGLDSLEYNVLERSVATQILYPTYAAVASQRVLENVSQEFLEYSKRFEKVIFVKGDADLGVVEHTLLHELGHIAYQTLYPDKIERRRDFYTRLKEVVQKQGLVTYLLTRINRFAESNQKARVFMSLESDELFANRYAYTHNTDKTAYVKLVEREIAAAKSIWNALDYISRFDIGFHMVMVDMYSRVIERRWVDDLSSMHRWLVPYTMAVVDALDKEDHELLFARQLLLFNAVNGWMETSEEEIMRVIAS